MQRPVDQHFATKTCKLWVLGVLLEVLSAQFFPLSLNLSLVVHNIISFIYYVALADLSLKQVEPVHHKSFCLVCNKNVFQTPINERWEIPKLHIPCVTCIMFLTCKVFACHKMPRVRSVGEKAAQNHKDFRLCFTEKASQPTLSPCWTPGSGLVWKVFISKDKRRKTACPVCSFSSDLHSWVSLPGTLNLFSDRQRQLILPSNYLKVTACFIVRLFQAFLSLQ